MNTNFSISNNYRYYGESGADNAYAEPFANSGAKRSERGALLTSDRYEGPAPSSAELAPTTDFRVVSYNIENLFDDRDDPHTKDEDTPPKAAAEMAKIAQALREADGDVVTLQEVENIDILNEFLDRYLPGQYPYRALVEGNDIRGIDVAIISKHPIERIQSHRNYRVPLPDGKVTRFRRDLLRADIKVGDYPVAIYTTHLKAQAGGERADRVRLGEAQAIRDIITEEMAAFPDQRYILTGDFNDTPDSEVGQVFLDQEQWHMHSALAELPPPERITHPPTKRTIDYVLYSDNMQGEFHRGAIQESPPQEMGSDHWLIYGDFCLGRAP